MSRFILFSFCTLVVVMGISCNAEAATPTTTAAPTTCPDKTDLANGTVNCVGKKTGQTCTFGCNIGYKGNKTVTCQPNGTWSGNPPTCQQVHCQDETNLNHGYIFCKGATYGDTCQYTCDTFHGYGKTVTCQADGNWSKTPVCGAGCSLTAAMTIVGLMSLLQYIITNV